MLIFNIINVIKKDEIENINKILQITQCIHYTKTRHLKTFELNFSLFFSKLHVVSYFNKRYNLLNKISLSKDFSHYGNSSKILQQSVMY
ncbi:unnamed protein product (macronuclear) [Paramecium tetraurelia]|uniref:Uncharacterized protein n=1 Tax=Paramecium tetraurelia TaxID=5888 RepID=A0D456_PARTE|nr:uncharacterized protein GSPATT00013289001 [Paramecium tetraurelia]CAK77823.1 unnamed protein product [Paramecium tetraurelia]|eukprot:XP_001445220.1 hypothetical protein (macronuclear) [Paramecium tetraurelia strain d4-2]